MCDICKSAGDELVGVIKALEEKYPAAPTIQGEPVPPFHHVASAIYTITDWFQQREMKWAIEQEAKRLGVTPGEYIAQRKQLTQSQQQQPSQLFGGPKKEAAA